MGVFDRPGGLLERAALWLRPLADRGALRGRAAAVVDRIRVRNECRLDQGLRRRLNRLERARAAANLARIEALAPQRELLAADARRYVHLVLAEHLPVSAAAFPFLCTVGPVGGEGVFRLPRTDVDAFVREVPDSWRAFTAALSRFAEAEPAVQREVVGLLVECVSTVGNAARRRRRLSASEEERLERLGAMLEGREPAAATDAEVTISLSRAFLTALRSRGEEARFESQGASGPDARP